jgi:hypothetical protein
MRGVIRRAQTQYGDARCTECPWPALWEAGSPETAARDHAARTGHETRVSLAVEITMKPVPQRAGAA